MPIKDSVTEISVIIPTYKPGEYLFECLDSILHQTFDLRKLEVVLVLNGPRDPFFSMIQKYAHQNEELNLVLGHCEHAHVSAGRNMGLQMTTGEFVLFMDDDDMISSTYVSDLFSKATTNGVVFSNVLSFATNHKNATKNYLSVTYDRNTSLSKHNWMTLRSHMSLVWGKLFPLSMIQENKFDLRFKNGQDALFMALISYKIKTYSLASENAIYYWRDRSNSASRKSNKIAYEVKNTLLLMKQYMSIFLSAPLKYNIIFFGTRLLAVIKRLRYRIPKSSW